MEDKIMLDTHNELINIRNLTPYLKPALKKVATYILDNPNRIKLMKIKELAKECKVSEATITRFVKETKFKTFQELKIALAEITPKERKDLINTGKFVYNDLKKIDSIETIIHKIASKNIEAIENTQKIIRPTEIKKAISAIEQANTILIYCVGPSTIAGENAKLRFYRIGKKCLLFSDPDQQAVSASLLSKPDLAMGICDSGKTKFTVNALKIAKEAGATTLCITNSNSAPIVKYSDIKLFTFTERSGFLQESMVSRLAQIVIIIDIIYASFATKHFNRSLKLIEKSSSVLKKAIF
jgi:RpiR family carbohydrate utilization transcriptional regulator